MELTWSNCPPDLNSQAEPDSLAGLLDADGGSISDGNNWPLRFPGPVTASPLVADLDGDGDLEYVVQAGEWYSRIHVYDLAAPAAPGMTLPKFLGLDVLFGGARMLGQRVRNRLGTRFPGLESKPPLRSISDPANMGPDASPAEKAAAAPATLAWATSHVTLTNVGGAKRISSA